MAWEERLREAAYTSPSGRRFAFGYENVKRETSKRTTAFEFPGVDGTYIQDNGRGGRRYPLRCFFSGGDHDLEADAFEEALLERGTGRLEHPFYGTVDVVPFGEIERRDDLQSGANQSVIEVTFFATLGTAYPRAQSNPASDVLTAVDAFDAAASEQFAASIGLGTSTARAGVINTFRDALGLVSARLSAVAAATTEVKREFDDAVSAVNLGLDVLIGQPLQLAQQTLGLVRAPAAASAAILDRLAAYAQLAEDLMASTPGQPGEALGGSVLPTRILRVTNDFRVTDLVVLGSVTGAILSVLETTFETKPAALAAAEEVLAQLDAAVAWRDAAFIDVGELDSGEAYQALQAAAAIAAGYLVEISFSLLPERRVTLDRPRTIIDLAAELYGSVDDRLDFLIASNDLTGDEILELPAGKVIRYYA